MNFDIASHTIRICLTGSRLYGTNNEDSDYDYKGIAIAPLNYYLGTGSNFEQYEGKINWHEVPEKHECVIYDIRKYCHLASLANPNILEILFADHEYYLDKVDLGNISKQHMAWIDLQWIKEAFLSKKVRHTYAGYAHAQLKKIRTHRYWLLNAPKRQPVRTDFDLPDISLIDKNQLSTAMSMVDKQIERWCFNPDEEIPITIITKARESISEMVAYILNNNTKDVTTEIVLAAGTKLGFDDNFLEVLAREKKYLAAKKQWKQFLDHESGRNEKRYETEKLYGYDTKHGMHLVRLIRTGEELMTTGKLIVTRPDAEELKAIRAGVWTYDQIEEFAESMDKKMDKLYNDPSCPLPHKPNIELIDKICTNIIREFHDK